MADEKFDEKEMEKREEKSPEEKSWDEKWRRDPLGTFVWASIFIWAGVVLLVGNLGFFDRLEQISPTLAGMNAWSVILLGAGLIIIGETVIRTLVPAYRRPVGGSLILAVFLIGIGLSSIFGWDITWPLILIAVGFLVLLRGLFRRGF